MQCVVTRCVICIPNKVEYLDKKLTQTEVKILLKKLYCEFKCSLQCIQENTEQNFES